VGKILILDRFRRGPPGWRLGAFVGVLACGIGASGARPAPLPTVYGLASMLGDAVHQLVAAPDIRWEPSRGTLADLVLGRRVLFLASDQPRGPRDVWRAAVRVTPDGHLLDVAEAHNLTETPLGDDHTLVMREDRAAFSTFAYGQEQSVSLLDLSGDRASRAAPDEPALDRLTRWLTNLQETGSGDGAGRIDVTLEQPAVAAGLTLQAGALQVDLLDADGSRRHAELDCDKGELTSSAAGMHADVVRHLPKRFVLWAVDTVRAVPWIGPGPVAWLEERVFGLRDDLRQLAFKVHGADATETLADSAAIAAPPPPAAAVLDASQAIEEGHWPPVTIPSIWKTLEPGEGVWQAPRLSWMKKLEVAGVDPWAIPPAMLRTFVRPDPERPYTRVILVAMDMRQLDFDMEAGTEDPKPLTGGHGPGRIPRDPATYTRVVAAFNGAFKTEHGNYGMMVHKRVLLPPQPGAASIVVLSDDRVGFGTWADTHEIGRIRGVDPSDIVSFRQNLDALVDQGEVNPMGRAIWGYTLPGQGMQTERSGLCVTSDGHMLFAWGDDVSGTALGKAMKMGGCSYAMHLDMNPHHTGFIFAAISDLKTKSYHSELLTPLMTVSPDRYIEYAPKDFFYVMLHDPTPPLLPGATWKPNGPQPPPAWAPALWSARVDGAEGPIDVFDIEAGRAAFRIRAGTKEPDAKTGALPLHELEGDDAHRVILSMGLSHATEKRPRGLATDGKLVYPIAALTAAGERSGELGLLVAQPGGSLSILKAEELSSISAHMDVAEVPLVLDGDKVLEGRKSVAPEPRTALGITRNGRVVVARGVLTSEAPLAGALRHAGCTRAVALDRGAHTPGFLDRAGTDTPPRGRYEDTVLYALARPMMPRAFRFEADTTVADAGGRSRPVSAQDHQR
jgi:hypothetical protein